MVARHVDRAIDGLAQRQHGAFQRRQAIRVGATRGVIERRETSGRWLRLAGSEVFALPSHKGNWHRQAMAATLSVPGSAVCGRAAAALHGFPDSRRGGIEVVGRRGSTHRSPFARVHESIQMTRAVVIEGIRVVPKADCLIQLVPQLGCTAGGALVDELLHSDRQVLESLRERYVQLSASRLPGIREIRKILDDRGDGFVPPASLLEHHLRTLLTSIPTLPTPIWDATPPWWEPGSGRVDALIEPLRLIVEADGRRWHTRVDDFERDNWRDAEAAAHGYGTMRFTWFRLTRQRASCRNLLIHRARRRAG